MNEQQDNAVHMNHCNQGLYIDSCKYGEFDTCPALVIEASEQPQTIEQSTKKLRYKDLTPEQLRVYSTWYNMRNRVFNKNNVAYKDYGGRGITIYEGWANDFTAFYEYMGSKPKPVKDYSIDRIDNDKGYEPGNVRWANRHTQQMNRRVHKNTKSGVAGITWSDKPGKVGWIVQGSLNGKNKHVGIYDTFAEAVDGLIDHKVESRLEQERVKAAVEGMEKLVNEFIQQDVFADDFTVEQLDKIIRQLGRTK